MKPVVFTLLICLLSSALFAQDTSLVHATAQTVRTKKVSKMNRTPPPAPPVDPQALIDGHVLSTIVLDNGDTIPVATLSDAEITAPREFKSKSEERRYRRLEKNIRRVYPYAKLAGEKLRAYEAELKTIESERKKKKFYKKVERELKDEFEGELTKLSVSQGRILIKLIDRETGDTSYELVTDLRGRFSAFFWQGLARIFGHNLKSRYDPEGADRMIEEIVSRIENE